MTTSQSMKRSRVAWCFWHYAFRNRWFKINVTTDPRVDPFAANKAIVDESSARASVTEVTEE